jgi:hypothetical protein
MPDPHFMLWGATYVILKWTFGAWAIRRVKAALTARPVSALRGRLEAERVAEADAQIHHL